MYVLYNRQTITGRGFCNWLRSFQADPKVRILVNDEVSFSINSCIHSCKHKRRESKSSPTIPMVPILFGLVLGLLPLENGRVQERSLLGWLVAKLRVTASDTKTVQISTRLQLS